MTSLYLLLGSNLGDREEFLAQAGQRLEAVLGKTAQKSGLYQTAAWGLQDQPAFLNQVLVFDTALPAQDVLAHTQQVEQDLGRTRLERWGARVIDIDLLFYGQQVIHESHLQVPHPQLHLRRFTLVPLVEVAPALVHPLFGKTVAQLLDQCPDALEVKLWHP